MNRRLKYFTVAILACLVMHFPIIASADAPVKREMRSPFVATVWQLDWPGLTISTTGNTSQIQRQKDRMITILDSLKINNFNAIAFQVRSRCDAMYQSSYEPWSSDLVKTRGMDPGYDPLEWVVEECHKRGIECHAWVNPYRYETTPGQWGNVDYRRDHPDWLLSNGSYVVINPGLPQVTQRIVDIINEIITKYDVDGILFDDYFYPSGGTDLSLDADLYQAYVDGGGTLSQDDWRCDNVNRMVIAVHDMIRATKPWVRFGIAPAGVAASSPTYAEKFGVTNCPSGYDWQYGQIHSEPLAWLRDRSIDYIAPQVYWTIGANEDYSKIAPWWYYVSEHFGANCFISHSISSLSPSSTATPLSSAEITAAAPCASGPNNENFTEYANEIRVNRQSDKKGAPGSMFYSVKYIWQMAPKFGHYLKNQVYNTPALAPAMKNVPVSAQDVVTNLNRSGNSLQWNTVGNNRYSVYAVPTSISQSAFDCQPNYLLGVSYSGSYDIPTAYQSGYRYAVCILDRFGNEYSPVFSGETLTTLASPKLLSPVKAAGAELPVDFEWTAVAGASYYIVEVSDDASFPSLLGSGRTTATTLSSSVFNDALPRTARLYWRVRACGVNAHNGVSTTESFAPVALTVLTPSDAATDVSLTPTVTWNISRSVTLQFSMTENFSKINCSIPATGSTVTVPQNSLSGLTKYYLRLAYEKVGTTFYSDAVSFTTVETVPPVPTLVFPVDGGEFRSEDRVVINPVNGIRTWRVELDNTESVISRTRFVESVDIGTWASNTKAGAMKVGGQLLAQGTTYYMRVRATYMSKDGQTNTEWSPIISATYMGEGASVDAVFNDDAVVAERFYTLQGVETPYPESGKVCIRVTTFKSGKVVATKVVIR